MFTARCAGGDRGGQPTNVIRAGCRARLTEAFSKAPPGFERKLARRVSAKAVHTVCTVRRGRKDPRLGCGHCRARSSRVAAGAFAGRRAAGARAGRERWLMANLKWAAGRKYGVILWQCGQAIWGVCCLCRCEHVQSEECVAGGLGRPATSEQVFCLRSMRGSMAHG